MPGPDDTIPTDVLPRTVPGDEESVRAERDAIEAARAAEKRLREVMGPTPDDLSKVVEAMFKPKVDDLGKDPEPIRGGLIPIDPMTSADVEQLQRAVRALAARVTALEEAFGER